MRPPRSPASICPYSCSGRGMTASFHRRQPGGFSGLSPPLSYRKSMGRTSCCRRAPPSAPPSCCISSVGSRSPSNKSLRGDRGPEVGVRGMPSPFINLDERGRHTPHPNLLPLALMRKDLFDGVLAALFGGYDGERGARVGVQFLHDAAHIVLHRAFGQEQGIGNL